MKILGRRGMFVVLLACGCTPHDDGSEPNPPQSEPAPSIVLEPEPAQALPGVVAPALPELAPTRPLGHLDLLWTDVAADPSRVAGAWSLGTSILELQDADAKLLGDAAARLGLAEIDSGFRWRWRRAGPLVLALSGDEFTAYEAETGKLAWTVTPSPDGNSYNQFVSPRALVASVYRSGGDLLGAWALEDGRELWTRHGGTGTDFERVVRLWTDGERGYFSSEDGLEVFDPATGVTLWSFVIRDVACGVASGEGVVVIEDVGGHVVLDAELGSLQRRVSGHAARCSWEDYSYGVASAVVSGGRLLAFDSPPASPSASASPLRAYGLADGRELWHASGFGDDMLVADHDAVFVSRADQVLVALDAATGKLAAEITIGSYFEVSAEPVGGAAGPLLMIVDDEAGRWILGRREQAPTIEDYEIRGRLISDGALPSSRVAGVHLHVGEKLVKTDKRGRFVARGRGRGVIPVMPPDEPNYSSADDWTAVTIDRQRVTLDGSGSYDIGDIEAFEISME